MSPSLEAGHGEKTGVLWAGLWKWCSHKGTFGYILNLYAYFLMQVGFNSQVLSSRGAAFG